MVNGPRRRTNTLPSARRIHQTEKTRSSIARPLSTESAEWAESARSGSVAAAMPQVDRKSFLFFGRPFGMRTSAASILNWASKKQSVRFGPTNSLRSRNPFRVIPPFRIPWPMAPTAGRTLSPAHGASHQQKRTDTHESRSLVSVHSVCVFQLSLELPGRHQDCARATSEPPTPLPSPSRAPRSPSARLRAALPRSL